MGLLNDIILDIKGLKIDGFTGEQWLPIVKGVDLQLKKGEVLGLIGELELANQQLVLQQWVFKRWNRVKAAVQ